MRNASYSIVESESTAKVLVIRDDGPWNEHSTVTNDVDNVVAELHESGQLAFRRLFYYDSDGRRDEIVHENGVFRGFLPGA